MENLLDLVVHIAYCTLDYHHISPLDNGPARLVADLVGKA